jgi:hypothetical protein
MTIGVQSVGGSKGRPTNWYEGRIFLNACLQNPNGNILNSPCFLAQPSRGNSFFLLLNNDWFYQKGNVNSTTGGAVTGGALAARKRRC